MDALRFDAITRGMGRGMQRRNVFKVLVSGAISGAAARIQETSVVAEGNLTDYCKENSECNSPLVCIGTECDHCRKSGDCKVGWCCKGYSCEQGECVACDDAKSSGVTFEGCRDTKTKKAKDKKKKGKGH